MDIQRISKRLRDERAEVERALGHVSGSLDRSQADDSGELSLVDQHPADIATETEARELTVMQRMMLERRLRRLDEALERIEDGTYGRCRVCDRLIAEERLEALPETPYCIEHAASESSPAAIPTLRSTRG